MVSIKKWLEKILIKGDFLMNKSKIVLKSHEYIEKVKNKKIAIDATCGNGHDTLFLATLFNHVYAFDIQPLAIKRTKEKTEHLNNVTLINDDFNKIYQYVKENVDLIIFNLGFLPGSNKKVLTSDYNSEEAILNAYKILNDEGTMIICCYLLHQGGKDEYQKITDNLNINNINFDQEIFNNGNEILLYIRKND